MEASKLGFGVLIGRSDNGLQKRVVFVTMRCKKVGRIELLSRNSNKMILVREHVNVKQSQTSRESRF